MQSAVAQGQTAPRTIPAWVVRKRLPWLDGNANSRTLPGSFSSESILAVSVLPAKSRVPTIAAPANESDGSLVSVSLGPPLHKAYTPSAYSSQPPSDTEQPAIGTKQNPVSYEKLVERPPDNGTSISEVRRPPVVPVRASSTSFLSKSGLTSRQLSLPARQRMDAAKLCDPRSASVDYTADRDQAASDLYRQHCMTTALAGLDRLVAEAVRVAEEARMHCRTTEIEAVLDQGRSTLTATSAVSARMQTPFAISDIEHGGHSTDDSLDTSDYDSDASSMIVSPRSGNSLLTAVTSSVNSVLPVLAEPLKASLKKQSEVAEMVDEPSDNIHRARQPSAGACSRLYQPPSVDSIVIDFAYAGGTLNDVQPAGLVSTGDAQASPKMVQLAAMPLADEQRKPAPRAKSGVLDPALPSPWSSPGLQGGALTSTAVDGSATDNRRRSSHRQDGVGADSYQVVNAVTTHQPESSKPDSIDNHIRKRITAIIACVNTALVGLIAGIYAGEVPKIQYQLADQHHQVILGNVFLYIGLGISTLLAWPLPLLHGRKPYTLVSLAIVLPLQFPQAIAVQQYRSPETPTYRIGLLLPRAISGLALGFANVNFLATLFDLFGASLQSHHPHQETVDFDDIRRQGGGMGLWLGAWSWCFVGSLAVGFLLGAGVTANLDPCWGFYFVTILLAVFLLANVVAPETRRAPHRRSILHYFDEDEKPKRRVARGEVMLHLEQDGPKYWWEEMFAGVKLMGHMMLQPGFAVLALYLAWIYALVVLVTLLLGALLSRDYRWRPEYVGLAVFALAVGAMLSVPLTKANLFSRDRIAPPRTDSMTFKPRMTWSSHLVRRCIFTFALPIAGLAFTLSSPGPSVSWVAPTIISAIVGFLSCLAIAECIGLVMEVFDTCDLQPGVNSKHRLQSLESATKRRRTNYSSFPRVAAGLFLAQGLGFFFAAAATGISGRITRALGAQTSVGVVAGILLFFTIMLTIVLWRFRTIQVIPNHALGTRKGSQAWTADDDDKYWKPVIIGRPSGKIRRMNLLEMGGWSRWTEIRRLNKLAAA